MSEGRAAVAALGVVAVGAYLASTYQRSGEVDILARTIWGEARGETTRGRIAVANVVMNRMRSPAWPNTVRGVCLQPWQFSTWNANDPNRAAALAVGPEDAIYRECLDIARRAVAGTLPDVTGGATHYFARYINPPSWAADLRQTGEIGQHLFFA